MDAPTKDQLQKVYSMHQKELRQLSRMTASQFLAFKRNFSVGCLDGITKEEAESLLLSMMALNSELQNNGE